MKLPLLPNRTMLELCLSQAPLQEVERLSILLEDMAVDTVEVRTAEQLQQVVDRHLGEPFGFDVETVGVHTRDLVANLKASQKELEESQEMLDYFALVYKGYTKKELSGAYDAEVKKEIMADLADARVRLMDCKRAVKRQLAELKADKGALDPFRGRVATLQLSFGDDHYIMRREVVKDNLELFMRLFHEAPSEGVYMHNASFEYRMMYGTFGVKLPTHCIYDTMLAELMLIRGHWSGTDTNTDARRALVKLAVCIKRRFGIELDKGLQAGTDWEARFTPERIGYAVGDAITAYALAQHQKELLRLTGVAPALSIELQVLPVLTMMELRGITVELDALGQWQTTLMRYQDSLLEKLATIALWEQDAPVNVDSHVQLLRYLRSEEGLDIVSTESGELEVHKGHPFVALLLEYRQVTKLLSTYVQPYVRLAQPLPAGQGVVRGSYNQCLTSTGRFSSSSPNLQNVPARQRTEFHFDGQDYSFYLRDHIVAREGFRLVGGDLSQVEIRVLAEMAGDPSLIETCNINEDTHRKVASSIFGVPPEQITKEERAFGKVYNLAIPYGKKAFSLSLELGISMPKATTFLNKYFQAFPFVKKFMQECVHVAEKKGYIRLPSGSIRHCQNIYSAVKWERTSAENTTYNTVIQGTSADGMKLSLIRLQSLIDGAGLTDLVFPILTVHDEVVVEAHLDVPLETVRGMLTDALRWGTQYFCTLVNIEVGSADVDWQAQEIERWADLK